MQMLQIFFALTTVALLCLLLQKTREDVAIIVAIAAGVLALIRILPQLSDTFSMIRQMAEASGATPYLSVVLKAGVIAFCADFCAGLCTEAKQEALAAKIHLCARIAILLCAWPLILKLLQSVQSLSSP